MLFLKVMTLIQNRIYIKVIFLSAINVYFCAWIFHVFVLVGKKWKNPIMYIIIIHYDLRYLGVTKWFLTINLKIKHLKPLIKTSKIFLFIFISLIINVLSKTH
ncbi:hypothetical protein H8356DRAFT_927422 [Neocallimastix lanati (nom. inval.)]|uniref:Uncharacterized protein n=1 Tax=Neocallimastix californiae TaxID=1754190 RepID=A0A1Y2FTM1_9FUNG|nr:hypothetical protein H8356DRAFT_927422 [Neocallimastix sp. JGI-2020a]ORY87360.1 hypothetical protein LY90DRAFT_2473 [Neocallimastix californiae]|eukprot:ORY87360.1 hypothetical protein LY90DRAFT_2473 [Neocallimastix californiae]